MATASVIPKAFIWRRLHSLMGLWLVIFLLEHLLTNSQAALMVGNDGKGFIHSVNSIQSLPYLKVIELSLLGVPFFIHMVWGIHYLFTGKSNYYTKANDQPNLRMYPRNRAYTWQRVTSWLLLLFIVAHVIQMRFIDYPNSVKKGSETYYMVRLGLDDGLYTVAARLDVELFNDKQIALQKKEILETPRPEDTGMLRTFWESLSGIFTEPTHVAYKELLEKQGEKQDHAWIDALEKRPLKEGQVIAVANDFATAELLMVRDTFKSPAMIAIYTLFVLAACYHGFNGLWTFMITWGATLTNASQQLMLKISTGLMVIISFLGLAAVWGTYWINLKS